MDLSFTNLEFFPIAGIIREHVNVALCLAKSGEIPALSRNCEVIERSQVRSPGNSVFVKTLEEEFAESHLVCAESDISSTTQGDICLRKSMWSLQLVHCF
jgi:hypothetical protein